jgi:hypothetical protein
MRVSGGPLTRRVSACAAPMPDDLGSEEVAPGKANVNTHGRGASRGLVLAFEVPAQPAF